MQAIARTLAVPASNVNGMRLDHPQLASRVELKRAIAPAGLAAQSPGLRQATCVSSTTTPSSATSHRFAWPRSSSEPIISCSEVIIR